MVRAFSLLLLSVSVLLAQNQTPAYSFMDQAFMGAISTPSSGAAPLTGFAAVTNQSGALPLAFYLPDNNSYYTNGSWVYCSNLMNAGIFCTNSTAAKRPVYTPDQLNGYGALMFDAAAATYLRADDIAAHPVGVSMVISQRNDTTAVSKYYLCNTNGGALASATGNTSGNLRVGAAGVNMDDGAVISNKWYVLSFIFGTNNSGLVWTNDVRAKSTLNNLTVGLQGMVMGGNNNGASGAGFALASMVLFTNATEVAISNSLHTAYGGYTNAFNIAF